MFGRITLLEQFHYEFLKNECTFTLSGTSLFFLFGAERSHLHFIALHRIQL